MATRPSRPREEVALQELHNRLKHINLAIRLCEKLERITEAGGVSSPGGSLGMPEHGVHGGSVHTGLQQLAQGRS